MPYWRKQAIKVPPNKAFIKYAKALSVEKKADKASFESEALRNEYDNFFKKPDTIVHQMSAAAQNNSNETIIPVVNSNITTNRMPDNRNVASGSAKPNGFPPANNRNYKSYGNSERGNRNSARGFRKLSVDRRSTPYFVPDKKSTRGRNNISQFTPRTFVNGENTGANAHHLNNIIG